MKRVGQLFPILVFCLIVGVFHLWFFDSSILTHSDWNFIYPDSFPTTIHGPSLWLDSGLGGINLFLYFYPIDSLMQLLHHAGFNFGEIERIVFMVPAVSLSYWAAFILGKKILANNYAATLSGTLYTINTYTILLSSGHLTIFVAMGLLPLVIHFWLRALEEKSVLLSILSGVCLTALSFYEFRIYYVSVIVIITLQFVSILVTKKIKNTTRQILHSLTVVAIPLFVHMPWIIALSKVDSLQSNTYFQRDLFGNNFLNVSRAATVFHPFWGGSSIKAFTEQTINKLYWIFPVLYLVALRFSKKKKYILQLSGVALVGILLTKQIGEPFSGIYPWLFRHAPGFNAFREASKFYILITLSYSVLIPYALVQFFTARKVKYVLLGVISTLIILAILTGLASSIVHQTAGGLFTPRTVPDYYLSINRFLTSTPGAYKVLWLPRKSRWSFYSDQIKLLSMDELLADQWREFIHPSDINLSAGRQILAFLDGDSFDDILMESGIKYIIVPSQDTNNGDIIFDYYLPRDTYITSLKSKLWLEEIPTDSRDIQIFQVIKHYNLVDNFDSPQSNDVNYIKIEPHLYDIWISTNPGLESFNLIFTNTFNSGWELKTNDMSSQLNVEHSISTYGLNIFSLNVGDVCQMTHCITSDEGNTSIHFKLFFSPQQSLIPFKASNNSSY